MPHSLSRIGQVLHNLSQIPLVIYQEVLLYRPLQKGPQNRSSQETYGGDRESRIKDEEARRGLLSQQRVHRDS